MQPVLVQRHFNKVPVTIANGGTQSGAIDMRGHVITGIAMPAAWTAADLRFEASVDGGTTWQQIAGDDGNDVQIVAATVANLVGNFLTNKAILEQIAAAPMIRLVSSVAQGADRVFTVVLKG